MNNPQLSTLNSQLSTFIKKEFLHIFRDRRTVLILIAMPIVQIILFGFAITTDIKNTPVAIIDPSNDVATRRIIDRIDASDYFTVSRMMSSTREIDEIFKQGDISFVIAFSENFGENLFRKGDAAIQFIADGSEPNQAISVTNYASQIVASYQQELVELHAAPFRIQAEIRMLYNPAMKSAFNFVPGVMGLVFILICAMMTSISIVREKETGTMEVLLASPLKPIYVIVSKMVPYFVLSCVNLASILLLSVFVLDVPVAGSVLALCLFSLLYILLSLAIGMLISTLVDTQVAAMLISGMVLMMPVMLLSGMIFPVESMPPVLQWLSHIVPARWYIEGVKKIMIQGVPSLYIIKETLVLLFMTAGVILLSLKRFKVRL